MASSQVRSLALGCQVGRIQTERLNYLQRD